MPDDSKTTSSPKSKPTTRSSIRQSLNLASKVFADAMSKDGREASKNAKKAKDSSRRSSVLSSMPSGPRASMGDLRPPSQVSLSKRTSTPESKTFSRRRASTSHTPSSPDEQPRKSLEPSPQPLASIPRTSTLRPRNLNATGTSALPKYRPKSVLVEATKPPSPTRAGTRRRFSNSDDEKKEQKRPTPVVSPDEKISRPISPLPHRAALRTNLTNSAHVTPPTTPLKPKIITTTTTTTPASSAKASPSRPAKIVKTGAPSTSLPRPLSASSNSLLAHSATTPKSSTPTATPKSTGLKAKLGISRSVQDKNKSDGQSTRGSPSRSSPSPLARRKSLKSSTVTTSSLSGQSGNMSHISEGNSGEEDSDADDVALLLAPVAALGAPTPAMPRIQTNRQRHVPQTPSRGGLPSRANMSYVSPAPPNSIENSLLLRPPPARETAGQTALRGSIMSWEQLANNTSVTLAGDEFGRMLSEIPAPFRSGAASPSLSSHFDVPESPCLSAIDSPSGFGSISQVLLPDVTPSPAMHSSLTQSRFSLSPDTTALESSTITLLRLQLAAAENTAKERLNQIQAMEEEFHNVQQAHSLQMEEMRKQAAYMESQWRAYDEQTPLITNLEEQLRQAQLSQEQAVAEAVTRSQEQSRVLSDRVVKAEGLKQEVITSARLASFSWDAVHNACEVELDVARGDRALLSVLLAQLDQLSCL